MTHASVTDATPPPQFDARAQLRVDAAVFRVPPFDEWESSEADVLCATLLREGVNGDVVCAFAHALTQQREVFAPRAASLSPLCDAPSLQPVLTIAETTFYDAAFVIDFGSGVACVFQLTYDPRHALASGIVVCAHDRVLLWPSDAIAHARVRAATDANSLASTLDDAFDFFVFDAAGRAPCNADRPPCFPPIGHSGRHLLLAVRYVPRQRVMHVGVDGLVYTVDLSAGEWQIASHANGSRACYHCQGCFIKGVLEHLSISCDARTVVDLDMLLHNPLARVAIRTGEPCYGQDMTTADRAI